MALFWPKTKLEERKKQSSTCRPSVRTACVGGGRFVHPERRHLIVLKKNGFPYQTNKQVPYKLIFLIM